MGGSGFEKLALQKNKNAGFAEKRPGVKSLERAGSEKSIACSH
jgi:hypothetical protein